MEPDFPPDCEPFTKNTHHGELVKRLKVLSEVLHTSNTNAENNSPNRFKSLSLFLNSEEFIDHHNHDVKILTACCLSDLFRIFSPKTLFEEREHLKDVLSFFIYCLKGLESPNSPHFKFYLYLLENLSANNTFHVAKELPGNDSSTILKQLIKTSMSIVNNHEWTKNREVSEELNFDEETIEDKDDDKHEKKEKITNLLICIMTKFIESVDMISFTVLDSIFFYLINPQQSNYRESYNLAKILVQATHAQLDAPIENLLTRSLLIGGLPIECELVGNSLKKLYDVIIELHDAVPSLVTPIIPQIGHFLTEDNEEFRIAAMKAVAKIAQNPGSRLFEDYNSVWTAFIQRSRDAVVKIRLLFAKLSMDILLNASLLRGSICDALCRLLNDQEESVRQETLNVACETARRKLESINEKVLQGCCERLVDSKHSIRLDALQKLLQLYAKVISGEEYTSSDKQVVHIIVQSALKLYLAPAMKDEQIRLERHLAQTFVPYKLQPQKRMNQLVDLYSKLDLLAAEKFILIIRRNYSYRRIMREISILLAKTDLEMNLKQKEVENRIERISKEQIHPAAFYQMMKKLTNWFIEDKKASEELAYITGNNITCTKVSDSVSNLLSAAVESKCFTKEENNMIRHFLERMAPLIVDNECAEILTDLLLKADGDYCVNREGSHLRLNRISRLLIVLAEHLPHVFLSESVQSKLRRLCDSTSTETVCTSLEIMKHSFNIPKFSHEATASYKEKTKKLLLEIVLKDDPQFSRCNKLAVYTLARLCPKPEFLEIINDTWEEHKSRLDISSSSCLSAIRTLMAIAKICPDEFEEDSINIVNSHLVRPIVLSSEHDLVNDPKELDLFEENIKKLSLPKYTLPKAYGLKMLCRQLTGKDDQDGLAEKTLKILKAFLEHHGDLFTDDMKVTISPAELATMRAFAGSQLLKLSYFPKYQNMISLDQYIWIGNLVLDEASSVRKYFMTKLDKGCNKNSLIVEYMALFSLLPILKEQNNTPEVARFVSENFRNLKQIVFQRSVLIKNRPNAVKPKNVPFWQPEYVVAYSCFLLAMQPICENNHDVENLEILRECLWFILEAFLHNKSTSDFDLISQIFCQVRRCRSVYSLAAFSEKKISRIEAENINKKMWALADLGLSLLVHRAKLLVNTDSIDEPILSTKFFRPMKESNNEVYAPSEMLEDEEKRNGKLPIDRKKKMNGSTLSNRSIRKRANSEQADGKPKITRNRNNTSRSSKPAAKRKNVIIEESEEEKEESSSDEEIIPVPSKRRALAANDEDIPATRSSKSPKKSETPMKSSKPSRRGGLTETSKTSSQKGLSLEELQLSPIEKTTPASKRSSAVKTKGLVSSTPFSSLRARKLEFAKQKNITKETTTNARSPRRKIADNNKSPSKRNPSNSPSKSIKKKEETKIISPAKRVGTQKHASSPSTRQTRSSKIELPTVPEEEVPKRKTRKN